MRQLRLIASQAGSCNPVGAGLPAIGPGLGTAQTPIVKRSERLLLNLAVVIVPLHYLQPRQGGI